ncbi:MAG: UDP-N-acetylmuramate dehydrogenase [candidate division WOR-3 bacterium]|nr:UDP-N-acetylmuramate dehydrogenase [candidate division WOR-3 bacterium]
MRTLFNGIKGLKVFKNEPLSAYTSLRIGGRARYLIKVYDEQALWEAMEIIKRRHLNYLVLGKGTNILFPDRGFDGVVIKLHGTFQRIEQKYNIFSCGGGVLIKDFVKQAQNSGYGGVEFLVGIPGTIGGAVKGNAGAFGKAISDVLTSVTIIGPDLRIRKIKRNEINFDYRKSDISDEEIIINAEFKLKKIKKQIIENKINEYLKIRREKQPRGFSAGSFFKNPRPLSAGRLIDECGLKGLRVGDAMVSKKHANFIINLGRARARDVLRLVKIIQNKVKALKGIELEPEVRIVK